MSNPYNAYGSSNYPAHGQAPYIAGSDHAYLGSVTSAFHYSSPQMIAHTSGSGYHHHASPASLYSAGNPPIQPTASASQSRASASASSSTYQPKHRLDDWGVLAPGEIHQISIDVPPTPQSIIDGSYQRANALKEKDVVIYVPRRPEFTGPPSIPSILFSVNGKPGPYIRDVAKGKVVLDGAYDQVLYARAWKQTWFMIEWPGTENSKEALSCFDEKGRPVTRAAVATHISSRLCHFITSAQSGKLQLNASTKDWQLKDINYRDVRLMSLNYYKKTWIPVLAFDMVCEE